MTGGMQVAVVDASVVLKWLFDDEECTGQAVALRNDFYLDNKLSLFAPRLLVYEISNGVLVAAVRKRIEKGRASEALSSLLELDIQLMDAVPESVLDAALMYAVTAYDAAYVALALALQCDFWTGDRQLYSATRNCPAAVRWIGDYPLPAGID